jgi:uncharacterized protein (TIGR02453 family)
MAFEGFAPAVFAWFAGLERDNSKAYFTATRERYERDVRGGLEDLLDELAGEFGGRPRVFRQQRDLRFSPDKSPYKTRTYGVILERPDSRAALYAELSRPGLFAGSGYHVLDAARLERFRNAVMDERSGPELERAIAGIETFGEALKTAPRGYPRDHPRVRLLRHKSLVAGNRLAPRRNGISRGAALEHVRGTWNACAAMNAWLDAHVGAT